MLLNSVRMCYYDSSRPIFCEMVIIGAFNSIYPTHIVLNAMYSIVTDIMLACMRRCRSGCLCWLDVAGDDGFTHTHKHTAHYSSIRLRIHFMMM